MEDYLKGRKNEKSVKDEKSVEGSNSQDDMDQIGHE